jgi:hypothetical protein
MSEYWDIEEKPRNKNIEKTKKAVSGVGKGVGKELLKHADG